MDTLLLDSYINSVLNLDSEIINSCAGISQFIKTMVLLSGITITFQAMSETEQGE